MKDFSMLKGRLAYIDIAKCLCLIAIIRMHFLPRPVWTTYFVFVPVFFVLSGYTYKNNKSFSELVAGKFKRLIIPYLLFNIVLVLINGIVYGFSPLNSFGFLYSRYTLYDMTLGYEGNPHLFFFMNMITWFLTSMFVAYLAFFPLVKYGRFNYVLIPLYLLLTYCLSFLEILLPWSLDTSFLMAIFLWYGYSLSRWGWIEKINRKSFVFALLLHIGLFYFYRVEINLSVRIYGNLLLTIAKSLTSAYLILCLCKWLDKVRIVANVLGYVGRHSLTIFSLQCFLNMCAIQVLIKFSTWQKPACLLFNDIFIIFFVIVFGLAISLVLKKVLPQFF